MAVTFRGFSWLTTDSTNFTVTATPAVGDLIVVFGGFSGNTATPTVSDNAGGAYTMITGALNNTSVDKFYVFVRTTLITSAVSTIFTIARSGTTTGGGLAVYSVSGVSTAGSAAVRGSGIQQNQATSTTPAPALPAAAKTTNTVLTACINLSNSAGITAPTSYTRDWNTGYLTPTTGFVGCSRASGETNATITWGSISGSGFASIVIEIDLGGRPFAQYDWPLPKAAPNKVSVIIPPTLELAVTRPREPVITPLRPPPKAVETINRMPLTPVVAVAPPFSQDDWPRPASPPRAAVETLARSPIAQPPFAQDDFPRPAVPPKATESIGENWALLFGPAVTHRPFNQTDFPLPRPAPKAGETLNDGFALLFGPAITHVPFNQDDWPLPVKPVTAAATTTFTPLPAGAKPFLTQDWRTATRPLSVPETQTETPLPAAAKPFVNPTDPPALARKAAEDPPQRNLSLLVPPVAVPFPARGGDLAAQPLKVAETSQGQNTLPLFTATFPPPFVPPLLQQPAAPGYREPGTSINVPPQPPPARTQPFAQSDFPNPVAAPKVAEQTLYTPLPAAAQPFSQTDWPAARPPRGVPETSLHAQQIPQPPQMLFAQRDWSLPAVPRTVAATVTYTPLPAGAQPFAQYDWQRPRGAPAVAATHLETPQLTPPPAALPFNQYNWENPHAAPVAAATHLESPAIPPPPVAQPFVQSDWPLAARPPVAPAPIVIPPVLAQAVPFGRGLEFPLAKIPAAAVDSQIFVNLQPLLAAAARPVVPAGDWGLASGAGLGAAGQPILNNNLSLRTAPPPLKPFNQSDYPLAAAPPQTGPLQFLAPSNPNLFPPVPPPAAPLKDMYVKIGIGIDRH